MRNILKYVSLILLAAIIFVACDPAEDRVDISGNVDKSMLKYTYKQLGLFSKTDSTNGSLLVLSQTSENPVSWGVYGKTSGFLLYSSDKVSDTIKLDFIGDYTVKVYGVFRDGGVSDSFNIRSAIGDPAAFKDPAWSHLSNKEVGKYWKIAAKYVGPESPYPDPPAWFQPDIATEAWANDSLYFDLNAGYNFKHYHAENISKSSFTLSLKDSIMSFKSAGVGLADNDNGEMAVPNVFKIFKLTADTVVFGQGASLTAARQDENWSWYWIYVRR